MQCANRDLPPSTAEHVRSAKKRLSDGDPRAALAELDLACLAAPADPYPRLLRGRSLIMLGRTEAALAELNAAIALDSTIADAWLQRALLRLERSEWPTAESDSSRALELDDTLARAWRARGIARYRLCSLVESAEDLGRSLDREPDDPSTHYWRGLALRDAGDNHAAVAEFDAAIRLNDRCAVAYVARGKARANLGDMAAARSDWAIAAQMLHHSH